MQYKNKNTQKYLKVLGTTIKQLRGLKKHKSRYNFCISYDLDSTNLRRIESAEIEPKITMLLRIAEALDVPLSDLLKSVENKLGKDFHIIEQ